MISIIDQTLGDLYPTLAQIKFQHLQGRLLVHSGSARDTKNRPLKFKLLTTTNKPVWLR